MDECDKVSVQLLGPLESVEQLIVVQRAFSKPTREVAIDLAVYKLAQPDIEGDLAGGAAEVGPNLR
jgi:hypothetical protein